MVLCRTVLWPSLARQGEHFCKPQLMWRMQSQLRPNMAAAAWEVLVASPVGSVGLALTCLQLRAGPGAGALGSQAAAL